VVFQPKNPSEERVRILHQKCSVMSRWCGKATHVSCEETADIVIHSASAIATNMVYSCVNRKTCLHRLKVK